MTKNGIVYLVGAGPGDPGLLTLRGRECLAQAEVVVHDYLANETLLSYAAPDAELIYVGKRAAQHSMEQEEINRVLVAKGKEGKIVVRLKGGDPFVFGRGGEEAVALREAGVAFEVVPGVTAGVAGPAYAGIPVTHRGFNSVLTLVTGHEDPTKEESEINWPALAQGGGTLVFYMGVKNLESIVRRLIEAGKSPRTPIALVHWGTLPAQRVADGTLENIVERVKSANLRPPCIIVVGDVVGLRPALNWFERRPLFGKTILITRSREQSSEFAEKLSRLGARVLAFHAIQIEPAEDEGPLRQCAQNPDRFDWIVFTSVNAVERFFAALRVSGQDSRRLGKCRICAIGPGTRERLTQEGIAADLVPPRYTSQGIFEALVQSGQIEGKRFLLPRADLAGKDLPAKLREAGGTVTEIEAYRTRPGKLTPEVKEAIAAGEVDIAAFTSSSTARNFASILRAELGRVPDRIAYVSIGPETTKAAREEGMAIKVEAAVHTIEGLVETIVNAFGSKS